jgi:hypothetical protein
MAAIFYYHYRRKRRNSLISKAGKVLGKREEVNYRNLDSKNIIDAFEKAPGIFYPSYREVPEDILVQRRDGKIEKVSGAASRLIEKLTEMASQRFVDVRTGMTSFFVVRAEDELVDEVCLRSNSHSCQEERSNDALSEISSHRCPNLEVE